MTDWADGIETRNYGIKRRIDGMMFSEFMRTIFALALVAGALVFHSWARNQLVNTGYESQNLFAEEKSLLRIQKGLMLEEETLRNPERIDAIARNDLGLAPLRPSQLLAPQIERMGGGLPNAIAMAHPEAADLKKPAPANVRQVIPNDPIVRGARIRLTIYE